MIRFKIRQRTNGPPGVGGKLFLSLFLFVFFAAGLFFTSIVVREVFGMAETYGWSKVDCQIVGSAAVERRESSRQSNPYAFDVRYTYSVNGQTFTSDKYQRSGGAFSDYARAQQLAIRYPTGTSTSCYVNPSNPSEAILERPSLWMALMIPLPLIFVAIGAGGIWLIWRKGRETAAAEKVKAISTANAAQAATGRKVGAAFFSLFLLIGLGVFYGLFIRPVMNILDAQDWPEVPCVVVSSQVRSHRSDDSTTYSVDILYAYTVNGREYKSSRYQFMGGSSSGYRGKAEIVNRHPPGTRAVCYVNPKDPTDAVLQRGFTNALWFGLIPLVFVLVGAGGVIFSLRSARRARSDAPTSRWLPTTSAPLSRGKSWTSSSGATAGGPVVLRPSVSPALKLVGVVCFAALWNGIVSVFVFQALKGWQQDRLDWFLTIFLIPFVLIGVVLLGAVGYFLLALFNPRPVLTVSSGAPPLGSPLDVQWRLAGRVAAVEDLRILLEGREEATYRRGTNTVTDKSVFATIELAKAGALDEKRAGQCRVTIPAGTMHTFASDNNKIVWALCVKGRIRWWPDVNEEFPLVILPAPTAPPAPA